jgi:hypothetical protein
MSKCIICHVGFGAYESENAETAILEWYHLNGLACDTVLEDDEMLIKDVFVGPIEACEESVLHASEIGYCAACIGIAAEQLANCKSAVFWIDDTGFRFSEVHNKKGDNNG